MLSKDKKFKMGNKINILVIIPARGGSKGVPRKNLRSLNGNPLIYYAINTALNSKYNPDVFVSSDDDEILSISEKIGAKTYKRKSSISEDKTTLDVVIYDAYINISKITNKKYKYIVTLQPTSPLLKSTSLDEAISKMINNSNIETVISAKDDTHLTWKKINNKYIPNYEKRVNRQYLTPVFKETGGFFVSKTDVVTKESRIGNVVDLYLLTQGEDIDIDTYEDWNLCEYYMKKQKILFVLTGYNEVGLGHIYRALQIANDILDHELFFLVDSESLLGFKVIKSKNYNVQIQKNKNIIDDIKSINPNIVINDILDTSNDYMNQLSKVTSKIINFEDLGKGASKAGIVINALYNNVLNKGSYYSGYNYFIARDEFILTEKKNISRKVENVLITFGGTDPNNLTLKTVKAISSYCENNGINITIIAGLGYNKLNTLTDYKKIRIKKSISNISDYMLEADIVFSSAGRTVYEIACIGTPTIILTQNERENSHLFAAKENGFINLGLGVNVESKFILSEFENLINNFEERKMLNLKMLEKEVRNGRNNVISIIKEYINK